MSETLARADANYYQMLRTIASTIEGGEVWEQDGILCVAWGGPVATFNTAFVTRPLSEPHTLVRAALAFFERRQLPFIVRAREGLDPAAEKAAEQLGLTHQHTLPGMVMSPIRTHDERLQDFRIERVDTKSDLEQYAETLCSGFGQSFEWGQRYLTPQLLDTLDVHLYLGYLSRVPVATSALFLSHRTAGIANVSTRPSARRMGIGEAMTWHAVNEGAKSGCVLASLQASEMGYSTYERMGFRRITGYRTFVKRGL